MMHPDEILKAMQCCSRTEPHRCRSCPYNSDPLAECEERMLTDAIELIGNLQAAEATNEKTIGEQEREIEELKQQIAWVKEPPEDDYDWRD